MNLKPSLLLLTAALLQCCSGHFAPPVLSDPYQSAPPAPDYSKNKNWAALPDKKDNADRFPKGPGIDDHQETARADVFFVHPTSFTQHTDVSNGWNADVEDKAINNKTDDGSILYQASVFNGCAKIYAPRYRQAFIYSYYTSEKETARKAFDTAYSDVKRAFEYYLQNYNNGSPFIIASHSQGTTHAVRLVHEFLDGDTLLYKKFIAAYLVGMDVYDTVFTVLSPCKDPGSTGCYTTWRTYAEGYYPPNYKKPYREAVCTNPISWVTDSVYVSREMNPGGILKNFNKVIPNLCDARVEDGVLRIHEPHFRGRAFFNFKNYHIVDFNLFYLSIRENALNRVNEYFRRNGK